MASPIAAFITEPDMEQEKPVGRLLGILLLVHLAGGLILPYVLIDRAMAPAGSVIENAAQHATYVRTAVVLFIAAAGLVLTIAITAWPVFRQHDERLAIAFVALAAANLALQLVESGTVLTLVSLGNELAANAGDAALQAAGTAAVFARRWAHFTQLLTVVSWLFVLYLTLWRTALVPRLLAALGMLTTLLQITGVPARAILGLDLIMPLAMPLAPVHVALACWLIARGLQARDRLDVRIAHADIAPLSSR
jgi:hypothetical protein